MFPVSGARPILRTEGATRPLLLDGDGAGLIAAAGAGLLDGHATVLYSPSYASQPAALKRELAAGADLVVTDTNRKQAEQFGTVGDNVGYTETADEKPLVPDHRDARLPLFEASPGDTNQTVAQLVRGQERAGEQLRQSHHLRPRRPPGPGARRQPPHHVDRGCVRQPVGSVPPGRRWTIR